MTSYTGGSLNDSKVSEESVVSCGIGPPGTGELPGFAVADFVYHDGFAREADGRWARNIAFRHRHPHFEIFWLRGGCGLIEREGEQIEVLPDSLLVIGPGDVHIWRETKMLEGSLLAVSEVFTSASNFSLPFQELTSFLQPNGRRTIRLNPMENALLKNVFDIMRDNDVSSSFDRAEVLKALLLILFSKIRGFHAGRGAVLSEVHLSPLSQRFKRALLSECPRLVGVKEFAEYLKVSRSYLHRVVLQEIGKPPSALIRDRLVFEAKRLLLHTTNSLAEIARHLGFRNSSYFSSFFLRHTGLSPRAFRTQRIA